MSDETRLKLLAPVAGFFVVIAFGVGVIATAALGDNDEGGTATVAAGAAGQTIEVELGDLFIDPSPIQAEPGDITFEVTNGGGTEHNFVVEGLGGTEMIPPGDGATLALKGIAAGEYQYICAVPGHADGGMKGTLIVSEGGTDGAMQAHSGMSGMNAKQMAVHDAQRTAMFPAETEGQGGVPLKPRVLADGTKLFRLTASEVEWETEPGKVVQAMAYNGMVPGPELRAELGDRVRIVLRNELSQPTSLHLHGMTVPNDMDGVPAINQDAILPGDSFTYEFTVRNTGSNMYHSHFNAVEQVPGGLLGAFIVSDPEDPESDIDHTMILNDGPLGFTINGKGFPATSPIVAKRGQVVRIRYMNEGLLIHPMHLHGMSQTVVAKDGHLLAQPYEADTILVGPGERYDVLVRATEPGAWAFHCHVLSHAEGPDGMFGMVTAMIVE